MNWTAYSFSIICFLVIYAVSECSDSFIQEQLSSNMMNVFTGLPPPCDQLSNIVNLCSPANTAVSSKLLSKAHVALADCLLRAKKIDYVSGVYENLMTALTLDPVYTVTALRFKEKMKALFSLKGTFSDSGFSQV